MTDLEKPKTTRKKPPTQTAGVNGIDAHGGMGEAPTKPRMNWQYITSLPAFEMFVFEESGHNVGSLATEWVSNRRSAIGDDALYDLYAGWHERKGLWVNETPLGQVK